MVLLLLSSALSSKPEQHTKAGPSPSSTVPKSVMKIQAGHRLVEVFENPERIGHYAFVPFIEHDDDAMFTVLRAVAERQLGKPLALTQYVESSGSQPHWFVLGSPGNQARVMIWKNTTDGEVFAAFIQSN